MDGGNFLIDLSSECNLSCSYCYQRKQGSLTHSEVMSIVNEFQPKHLDLGGGEPAIYPGISELVERILKKGITVELSTNTTRLMEWMFDLDESISSGLSLQLSIPTTDRSVYSMITGFDMLDQAMHNAGEYKKNLGHLSLNCAAVEENISSLRGLAEYASKNNMPLRVSPAINVSAKEPLVSKESYKTFHSEILGISFSYPGMVFIPIIQKDNSCPFYSEQFGVPKNRACPAEIERSVYFAPDKTRHSCQYIANLSKYYKEDNNEF